MDDLKRYEVTIRVGVAAPTLADAAKAEDSIGALLMGRDDVLDLTSNLSDEATEIPEPEAGEDG